MGDSLPWRPCYPSSTRVATSLVARISVVHQSPKPKQHMLGSIELHFQVHSIIVPMSFPLVDILHNPDTSGHITKWVVELAEFDIKFTACTAIKSQVLA